MGKLRAKQGKGDSTDPVSEVETKVEEVKPRKTIVVRRGHKHATIIDSDLEAWKAKGFQEV